MAAGTGALQPHTSQMSVFNAAADAETVKWRLGDNWEKVAAMIRANPNDPKIEKAINRVLKPQGQFVPTVEWKNIYALAGADVTN